jgi:hypothetical protein
VFAFKECPFSGNCEIFVLCNPPTPSHLRIETENVGRYSNTLLVSLNSRISIREEGNPRVSTRTQSIAFVVTSHRDASPTNITLKELEPLEVVYKPPEGMAI